MSGENDLHVGIQGSHHRDEAFLPIEVQRHLWFVHEEHIGLAILRERGEENDEHLFFSRRKHVGRKHLFVLEKAQFIAFAVDAFARFGKEFVHQIQKMRLSFGSGSSFFACRFASAGEESNHAVADVHLIVEISALQLIELPVEFGHHLSFGKGSHAFACHHLSIHRAHHVIAYALSISGKKVELHAQSRSEVQFARSGEAAHLLHHARKDGAFSCAIFSTQHIHVGAQLPDDVLVSAPKT